MNRFKWGIVSVVLLVPLMALSYTGILNPAASNPERASAAEMRPLSEHHKQESIPVFFNKKGEEEKDVETKLKEQANQILEVLEDQNFEELATYVHEEKGLLYSPYVNVNENDLVFEPSKVAAFKQDTEEYVWGMEDGSGFPIELTPVEYHEEYVYQADFLNPDEVTFDKTDSRGNMINNIKEFFQKFHSVEFYKEGQEELDWSSLYVVFEPNAQGEWKLVALVNDEWTI
ncbi:hypothetical protein SAMN04487943_10854 [Gracilibacillus orientalis]|uniref:Uncharacterized protein n=1 Tax=Gracilibacillus orientalis TaxID=334253 RepID=A0A1I4N9P6_9BACI|nr:hypothetical protein [Gracilibacillus orientalis]SFM12209.1 hypothetical protein SAMN04487943_10854 [Gracilibacillus orientalis]